MCANCSSRYRKLLLFHNCVLFVFCFCVTAKGELPAEYDKSQILSVHQLGAGKMFEEEQARLLNMRLYDQSPLTGPFGTFEKPAPILSNFNNRVVGCLGTAITPTSSQFCCLFDSFA